MYEYNESFLTSILVIACLIIKNTKQKGLPTLISVQPHFDCFLGFHNLTLTCRVLLHDQFSKRSLLKLHSQKRVAHQITMLKYIDVDVEIHGQDKF